MENSFSINVDLTGEGEQYLDVIPFEDRWDILLDGVSLGILGNNGNDQWYWIEGNLEYEEARLIGEAIENHYL